MTTEAVTTASSALHPAPWSLSGLYAITSCARPDSPALIEAVEQAVTGGAALVQYRDKSEDSSRRLAEAAALCALCRRHRIPFLINDDIALAVAVGADGVHLGQDDASLTEARVRLGPNALIGVSCYNRLELAQEAAAAGADYVAFGRFFPSRSKPDAVYADPELLRQARSALSIPVVAIGGITPDNGAGLLAAGADMLAVIDGLFGRPDIEAAARRYARLFEA